MTTMTAVPTYRLRTGRALAPSHIERWLERCEDGCRCIQVEQRMWPAVEDHGDKVIGSARTYQSAVAALADAVRRMPEDVLVMVNASDGTGRSFLAGSWSSRQDALTWLEAVAGR